MRKIIVLAIMMFALFVNVETVKGAKSMIKDGKKVKFAYTLTVDGQIVDSSEGREPLEYTHGEGKIIKGLEKQLQGLKVGQKKKIVVSAEEAYGQIDQSAILDFPKENINSDTEPQKGMMVQFQTNEGQLLTAIVLEVGDETITLDFNHPLAGKELHFDIEVVNIE